MNWCAMWGFLAIVFALIFAVFFWASVILNRLKPEIDQKSLLRVSASTLCLFVITGALCALTWGR